MKVLLRSDISGVGKKGDIVEVAKGFARNFLLPTGSALVAGGGIESQAAPCASRAALRDAQDKESAQTVADALSATPVTVTARAAAEGRLFGSVTTTDIAEALERADRRGGRPPQGPLAEPLKSVGTHVVPVQLHADVAPMSPSRSWPTPERPGRPPGAPRCHTRLPAWVACDVPCDPPPRRLSPGLPPQTARRPHGCPPQRRGCPREIPRVAPLVTPRPGRRG